MKKKPLEQAELIRLWTLVFIRVLLLVALVLAVIWILHALSTILLMLVLSIFFCYLIAPVVRLFEHPVYIAGREIKMPRGVAIGAVYVLFGGLLFLAIQWIVPILWAQITQLGQDLPNYIATGSAGVKKTFNDANSWMRHLKLPPEWRQYLLDQTTHIADSFFPWLQSLVFGTLGYLQYLPWLIIVPIISFFLLKDAESFEQNIVALMPNERLRKRTHWLLLDLSRTIAAYIRAQITACIAVGALVTLGFSLIGVPYAVVLGLLAGVLEFIPMVGPLVSALISVGLTMGTHSFKMSLVVALFLAVLRVLQDYIIFPRIVGHGIKMHPLIVVLAILAGAEIGGLSGVFLAIPFVGLIIVSYNHYLAYRGIESLQAAGSQEQISRQPETEVSRSGTPPPVLEETHR